MDNKRALLFLCWIILCVDICVSQRDCTGVACPSQENCIETVLEKGACCPTCSQRGCTCEGYQYYDCVKAGFQRGKVPEGESYFVDFGSTECSCPRGGGKISCHFIPCPEISPNCIDISQPADGCPQCRRIGCTHGNKKYEAGHTFHLNKCQVCHCPHEGGRLMCSPIPGCDLRSSMPVRVTTTENNSPLRDIYSRHDRQQTTSVGPFSNLAQGNTLPLYKQDPPSSGRGTYDYTLAGPTSSTIQDLAQPLESTTAPPVYPESSSTYSISHDHRRQGLRETQKSPHSERSTGAEDTHFTDPTTTGAQSETHTTSTTSAPVTMEIQKEAAEKTMRHNSDKNTLRATTHSTRANKGARQSGHHKHGQGGRTGSHGVSRSTGHKEQEKGTSERRQPPSKGDQGSYPTIQFSPTEKAPVRMKEDREQPQRQPSTLYNYHYQDTDEDAESKWESFLKCFSSILCIYWKDGTMDSIWN